MKSSSISPYYRETLTALKERIYATQYVMLKTVNRELVSLYWDIGKTISERQKEYKWGKAVVEQIAVDLQSEFPGIKGFSERNIWNMKRLYEIYKSRPKLQQLVAEISWGNNIAIIEKVKTTSARQFYLIICSQYGLSRSALIEKINNQLYEKYTYNQTNFSTTVDPITRTQAMWEVKDEYNFDFLNLPDPIAERELERQLVSNINRLLQEMGGDFCFVGNQYRIQIEDKEYFIDLVFYHRKLQCLIAIELKVGVFCFEYVGQIAGYLSALNHQVKYSYENPSIGIIICRSKNRTVVEYALASINHPIGIATFAHKDLPKAIAQYLPTETQFQQQLQSMEQIQKRE